MSKRKLNRPHTQDSANKLKFIGLIVFVIVAIALGAFIIHFIATTSSGTLEEQLESAISRAGFFGVLICLALQFIQIVLAFVPGEIIQVAIGYVYGTIGGGFVTLLGALISSAFVFFVVRKLGTPFVQSMIGNKDNRLMRFLKNDKRLNATVFILYLIPGLPKDVFTYLVPLTDMRPANFLVLSTIARAPAIFASTFVAAAFRQHNYVAMVIVAVIFGGMGVLGVVFNRQIMEFVDAIMIKLMPRRYIESHYREITGHLTPIDHRTTSSHDADRIPRRTDQSPQRADRTPRSTNRSPYRTDRLPRRTNHSPRRRG